jgi:hypothetical protein
MTEMPQFAELPESVRIAMKSNIDQGKKAFDIIMSSSHKTLLGIDTSASTAAEALKILNDKIAGYARLNADTVFQHALKLAGTRQLSDMVELQNTHVRETVGRLTKQFEELSEMTASIMKQTAQNVTSALPEA